MTAKRSTEDLIRDLAARPLPAAPSPPMILGGMLLALLVPLVLFWLTFGLRADLSQALRHFPALAKSLLPLALFLLAFGLAITSGRPGRPIPLRVLALPLSAGLVLVGLRLTDASASLWSEFIGQTAIACMTSITLMSLLPLWVAIRLFRHAAPPQPALTGALLGLAVGAGIATGYALHCSEDSPLFFMSWYVIAIGAVTGLGAIAGNRLLRW